MRGTRAAHRLTRPVAGVLLATALSAGAGVTLLVSGSTDGASHAGSRPDTSDQRHPVPLPESESDPSGPLGEPPFEWNEPVPEPAPEPENKTARSRPDGGTPPVAARALPAPAPAPAPRPGRPPQAIPITVPDLPMPVRPERDADHAERRIRRNTGSPVGPVVQGGAPEMTALRGPRTMAGQGGSSGPATRRTTRRARPPAAGPAAVRRTPAPARTRARVARPAPAATRKNAVPKNGCGLLGALLGCRP